MPYFSMAIRSMLGGGVVNRKVLENCNIDPDEYSGFAFGIGIDVYKRQGFICSSNRHG